MQHNPKNSTPIYIVVCVAVSILLRFPFINAPGVMDEPGYLQGVSNTINNSLNPFTLFDGYKPPVSYYPVAILGWIFGLTYIRMIFHLYIAIISGISLYYTYALGTWLYGKKTGILAAILLTAFPLFFIQGFLISDAVIVTALVLATLYYYFRSEHQKYLISATLLVLTKETMIPLIIILLVIKWTERNKASADSKNNKLAPYAIPLIFFAGWAFGNLSFHGWFLNPEQLSASARGAIFDKPAITVLAQFWDWYILTYFFDIHVILITILTTSALITSMVSGSFRKKFLTKHTKLLLAICACYIVGYYFLGIIERYILFCYALLIIVYARVLLLIFRNRIIYMLIIIMTILSFLFFQMISTYGRIETRPETDGSKFNYQITHTKVIQQAKALFPDAYMISKWPWTNYWTEISNGMVHEAGRVAWCDEWVPEKYLACVRDHLASYTHDTFIVIDTCRQDHCPLTELFEKNHSSQIQIIPMSVTPNIFPRTHENYRIIRVLP